MKYVFRGCETYWLLLWSYFKSFTMCLLLKLYSSWHLRASQGQKWAWVVISERSCHFWKCNPYRSFYKTWTLKIKIMKLYCDENFTIFFSCCDFIVALMRQVRGFILDQVEEQLVNIIWWFVLQKLDFKSERLCCSSTVQEELLLVWILKSSSKKKKKRVMIAYFWNV